jgi:shikimate dehydrogenase
MPFKSAILPFVDRIEQSAAAIDAANTIVNADGVLTAANTDYIAVRQLLDREAVPDDLRVLIRGSGSMAAAVTAALRGAGFDRVTVVARNERTGRALAERYGYDFTTEADGDFELLVNATPLGMAGPDAEVLAFEPDLVRGAQRIFDVVASPVQTPLVRAAQAARIPVITGAEVHALQAALQFERYTGVRLTRDQVDRASEFARRN